MNIAYRTPLTVPEYLAWAEAQTEKIRAELINGHIVRMSPERVAHNLLKGRIFLALHEAVRSIGIEAQVFTDGMSVPVDNHTAYEPDSMVRFGAPLPRTELVVMDPAIVVEVISPSSAHTDTSAKLNGYFKLPSVMHYLVVDPDARRVTHHARTNDGSIRADAHTGGMLQLDPPGLVLDLDAALAE